MAAEAPAPADTAALGWPEVLGTPELQEKVIAVPLERRAALDSAPRGRWRLTRALSSLSLLAIWRRSSGQRCWPWAPEVSAASF